VAVFAAAGDEDAGVGCLATAAAPPTAASAINGINARNATLLGI
jgi:hypothetical protein